MNAYTCKGCGEGFDRVWCDRFDLYNYCETCAKTELVALFVPVRYRSASFADWTREEWDKMLGKPGAPLPDPVTASLFIHGPVGTGKTHLVYAKVGAMLRVQVVPTVVKFDTMLRRLRSCFQGNGTETEEQVVESYKKPAHLVIDDFGGLRGEKVTPFVLSAIFEVVDHRNERKLQTDFTANKDLDGLAQDLDDRVTSRIYQLTTAVKVSGVDQRLVR